MNKYLLFFIILISILASCQNQKSVDKKITPIFGGLGNLQYDAVNQKLVFDGYKDDYFLTIKSQIKEEMIFFDDPGTYKLEYPGYHTLSLLKDRSPVAESITFHKSDNAASAYTINTNLQKHGFDFPLYGRLNDGWSGADNPYDGQWWCWKNKDAAIVVDTGEENTFVTKIKFRYFEDPEKKIFPPNSISISGSFDGINYKTFFVRSSFIPSNLYYTNVEASVNNNFRYYRIDLFAHSTDKSENAAPSYLLIDEVFFTEGKPTFEKVNVQ
jgi:hypothetical protein